MKSITLLSIAAMANACGGDDASDPTLAHAQGGDIQGVADAQVVRFMGVRYAAPPVGNLRWKPPQPAASWTGTLVADKAGPSCPQADATRQTNEDCLFMNIWAPKDRDAGKLPVMVWTYGGGFTSGAGSDPGFDGAALARRGVIVVTFNYRLNGLGFLPHPQLTAESPDKTSGNYALLDIMAAFQWVQQNIAAFGGDPGQVTAFGQSSGAIALSNVLISPKAKGLFQKVILESGGQMRQYPTLAAAEQLGAKAGDIAALRALDASKVPTLSSLETSTSPRPLFNPRLSGVVVDGKVVPTQQRVAFANGAYLNIPMMIGNVFDEGSYTTAAYPVKTVADYMAYVKSEVTFGAQADEALKLYPASSDADVPQAVAMSFSDIQYHYGTRQVARAVSQTGQSVYRYLFTRRIAGTGIGPNHADEIAYVFDNLSLMPVPQFNNPGKLAYNAEDYKLATEMADAWVRFAKTGDPNGGTLPAWPRYDPRKESILEFGNSGNQVRVGYRDQQLDFVDRLIQLRFP